MSIVVRILLHISTFVATSVNTCCKSRLFPVVIYHSYIYVTHLIQKQNVTLQISLVSIFNIQRTKHIHMKVLDFIYAHILALFLTME